jgi:Xaa-Pro aminopeptidase
MATDRPFSEAEYLDRERRVRSAMAAAGVDVLYVTSPSNIFYLTGYEAVWYPWRLPLGCAVVAASEQLIFYDWTRHEAYARLHARFHELVLFDYADAPEVVCRSFEERGLCSGTVGLEHSSPNPAAPVMTAVEDALTAAGATVLSGDWIVDGVRLLKSPAEVQRVRRAGQMVDAAFTELGERLAPGMTELQVAALLSSLLADVGSEQPAQPPLVSSGPTAWLDTHAFPSQRALEAGDTVTIDACASVDRYHANLARTFALGAPDPRAQRLLELGAASVDELVRGARIGDGPELALAPAERLIRDAVPAEQIWWIGGYSLGISFPPSWVGHTYLANDGLQKISWQPGYTSNYETIMFDREAGYEAGAIDTVLMTESGLEVLSEIPRTLIEVSG